MEFSKYHKSHNNCKNYTFLETHVKNRVRYDIIQKSWVLQYMCVLVQTSQPRRLSNGVFCVITKNIILQTR